MMANHQAMIHKICWFVSRGDSFLFDEMKQEVSMKLWIEYSRFGLQRFQHKSKLSSWLYKIAFYSALQYCYYTERTTKDIDYLPMQALDNYDPPKDEGTTFIEQLAESLSPRDRRWLGHYLNQQDYATIASMEGISQETARKRMSRLFKDIRDKYPKTNN